MPTEEEKMLAGELYAAFDPALVAARTRAKRLLHRLNVTEYVVGDAARATLAELVPHAGDNLWIEPPFHCDYGYNLCIGRNVYIERNCHIGDLAEVRIGDNTRIAPNVSIYTSTLPDDPKLRRDPNCPVSVQPVVIQEDCFIGGNAVILAGRVIGKGSIVEAGSVVTKVCLIKKRKTYIS